jgi:hypothetical protein
MLVGADGIRWVDKSHVSFHGSFFPETIVSVPCGKFTLCRIDEDMMQRRFFRTIRQIELVK